MCVFDIAEGRVKASLKIQRQKKIAHRGLTLKHRHTEKDRRKPYRFHWCMEGCPHPAKSRMAAPTNLAMTHEQRMRSRPEKKKGKRGFRATPNTCRGAKGLFDLYCFFSFLCCFLTTAVTMPDAEVASGENSGEKEATKPPTTSSFW